jgi:hypothetical protein
MNLETNKYKTVPLKEVYKLKAFHMLKEYEPTDKELKRFGKDFMIWVEELMNNNTFKIDYIKDNSHKGVTINMFKRLCHGQYEKFEPIDATEYKWIEACNNGALYYCKAGKTQCYGYDFKSQYPSILAYKNFEIPFKAGKESKVDNLDRVPVGFYKVKITSNDEKFKKIFAFSKENVYTHTSVLFAIKAIKEGFDVNIELSNDDVNCYIYDRSIIIKGSTVFKKWYDCLYKLKEKFPKNQLVKTITSSLWGQLARHNKIYKTEDEMLNEDIDAVMEFDPDHEYYIYDTTFNKKREEIYHLVNCKQPYFMNIARIKPFLLSTARGLIAKSAVKYINSVIRICVDNVTFDKQHDDICYENGTLKLVPENKTTGMMEFRSVNEYKHFDNPKYTTKNYDKDCIDESDDEIEFDE